MGVGAGDGEMRGEEVAEVLGFRKTSDIE